MKASVYTAVEVIPQTVEVSELDKIAVEQAAEYQLEQALIERAHPDDEQQILHRHDMCDGSCVRVFNGHSIDGVDCR